MINEKKFTSHLSDKSTKYLPDLDVFKRLKTHTKSCFSGDSSTLLESAMISATLFTNSRLLISNIRIASPVAGKSFFKNVDSAPSCHVCIFGLTHYIEIKGIDAPRLKALTYRDENIGVVIC